MDTGVSPEGPTQTPVALARMLMGLVNGRNRFPLEAQPQAASALARLSSFVAEQPPRVQRQMCALLRLERCHDGQVLQQQGGRAKALYILLKGTVDEVAFAADPSTAQPLRTLSPGECFGADATRTKQRACSTAIRCIGPCYFLKLDSAGISIIFETRALGDRGRLAKFLSTVPGLEGTLPAQLNDLAAAAFPSLEKAGLPLHLDTMKGVSIVRRGQLYLVTGHATESGPGGSNRPAGARAATWLSALGPGTVLGVPSLFPELRRNWYVETAGTVELLNIQKVDLKRILGSERLCRLRDQHQFLIDYLEGRHGRIAGAEPVPNPEESIVEAPDAHNCSEATVREDLPASATCPKSDGVGTRRRPTTAGPLRRTVLIDQAQRPQSAMPAGMKTWQQDTWVGSRFSASVIFSPELCDPVERSANLTSQTGQNMTKRGVAKGGRMTPLGRGRARNNELGLAWQFVLRERQQSARAPQLPKRP